MAWAAAAEEEGKAVALGREATGTVTGVRPDTGWEEAMALAMAVVAQEAQEASAVAVGQAATAD